MKKSRSVTPLPLNQNPLRCSRRKNFSLLSFLIHDEELTTGKAIMWKDVFAHFSLSMLHNVVYAPLIYTFSSFFFLFSIIDVIIRRDFVLEFSLSQRNDPS